MDKYIEEMLKEADKGFKSKEVPVGAIIVFNNQIISKAHNQRIKDNDVTSHAEIIAIRRAEKKLKDWRLTECDLYVTLEPCNMCMEIIKEARIRNVYYLIKRLENKKSYYKTNVRNIESSGLQNDILNYQNKLSDFFKLNCKR